MQRVAAWVMLVCYAALGSGTVEYWHNQQHAAEDSGALVVATAVPGSPAIQHDDHPPLHDESNCPIHLQLHLAGLAVAWVSLLICLGLFVAFLTMLAPVSRGRQVAFSLACRGPPAR